MARHWRLSTKSERKRSSVLVYFVLTIVMAGFLSIVSQSGEIWIGFWIIFGLILFGLASSLVDLFNDKEALNTINVNHLFNPIFLLIYGGVSFIVSIAGWVVILEPIGIPSNNTGIFAVAGVLYTITILLIHPEESRGH